MAKFKSSNQRKAVMAKLRASDSSASNISTSTYNLSLNNVSLNKQKEITKFLDKLNPSSFAVIDKSGINNNFQYKIAISQKQLFKLDDYLKSKNLDRQFTLL